MTQEQIDRIIVAIETIAAKLDRLECFEVRRKRRKRRKETDYTEMVYLPKSFIVNRLAKEMGANVINLKLSSLEPGDLRGVEGKDSGTGE